jgi:hypothetical protein
VFYEALKKRDAAMDAVPRKATGIEEQVHLLKSRGKSIGEVHYAFPNATKEMRESISRIYYGH